MQVMSFGEHFFAGQYGDLYGHGTKTCAVKKNTNPTSTTPMVEKKGGIKRISTIRQIFNERNGNNDFCLEQGHCCHYFFSRKVVRTKTTR